MIDNNSNNVTTGIGVLNPFRYRGYYYDTETGLYYLQTRYYDPEVGRFISQDSIEYADPETINGLNLYAYCGNNPVMNVDPSGKFFFTILFLTIGIGVVAGAVVGGISAAANNENVWDGVWKGALIGGLFGGSLGLVATGLAAPLVGTIWGSVAVAAGTSSAIVLGLNTTSQLEKGSLASLDVGSSLKSWGVALGVGALAGGLSYATAAIGAYWGEYLGLSLSNKAFLGVTISKIISKSFLASVGSLLGGALGGFLGGRVINYLGTDSGLQDKNVPLWVGTLLKLLFGNK